MNVVEKDVGFVLRRYNFRETSIIASLYTLRFGKISGILKGFYTIKREFTSSFDICTLNELIFYPKKNPIWLVSFADLLQGYTFLHEHVSKSNVAAGMVTLIDKTMQAWDSNESVFYLLQDCLQRLSAYDERKVFCVFLVKLLTVAGVKPELTCCLFCEKGLIGEIWFSVQRGGLICPDCRDKASDAYAISQQASRALFYIQKNSLDIVYRLHLSSPCQAEIMRFLREFIFYHLDFDILPYLGNAVKPKNLFR